MQVMMRRGLICSHRYFGSGQELLVAFAPYNPQDP
uniref:Uncharacterized protein n=1 Tax=Setaria viridis TaxID=4556 RepID=A0A4U6T2T1_SETVI|nr:hypothetical protein SEVIR_9G392000v2 [Setaria viridis]